MPIITISRGSYSRGKDVAEALAQRLNYSCVSRGVLLEASEEFSIPEFRLLRALHDAPSVFERFTNGKERFVSYIRSAFFNHVAKDNVVYHGLAGHFFLQDIGHAFKVRINAKMEDRVEEEVKREKCSADEARLSLKKDDEIRRQWSQYLYGKDTWNCSLYDMVLSIDAMTVDDAVDILAGVVQKGRYDATPESLDLLRERALLANITSQVVNLSPDTIVDVQDGIVTLSNLGGSLGYDEEIRRQTTERLMQSFDLRGVVFQEPLKAKKDYVNTFYNLDL